MQPSNTSFDNLSLAFLLPSSPSSFSSFLPPAPFLLLSFHIPPNHPAPGSHFPSLLLSTLHSISFFYPPPSSPFLHFLSGSFSSSRSLSSFYIPPAFLRTIIFGHGMYTMLVPSPACLRYQFLRRLASSPFPLPPGSFLFSLRYLQYLQSCVSLGKLDCNCLHTS